MERPAALTLVRRGLCGAVVATAMCGALAAPAGAAWTRPVAVSAPTSIDILGPQVASSQTGRAAVSFNETNLDSQPTAGAFVAQAARHHGFRAARAVPGAQEVLALAYSGSTLVLLTASAPPGQPCCTSAQVIRLGPGSGFGRPQTIVTNVGGGATGRLVPLANGSMLAVIAGPQRLWVTEAHGVGRFAPVRGLTPPGFAPSAVAVAGTPGGGSAIVWTQGSGREVFGASAGPGATPTTRHTLLTVPAGHTIDGVQLVSLARGMTMAWTESSSGAAGAYHSVAMAADLAGMTHRVRGRALSAATDVASALTLASDGAGTEVAAWTVCSTISQVCEVQSKLRRGAGAASGRKHRGRARPRWFGALSHLGLIDPGYSPQLAMATTRKALIGWIIGGRVALANLPPAATRFGPLRGLSGGLSANLTLGFGPTGGAVATWTEGTFAPAVFATRGG